MILTEAGMSQARRVSPRIPYDESVYLTRTDGTGRLLGRSVNLGITGIYVKCVEPCEIGTELICSVLLPGGPRKLRGRVVRIISLPRAVGLAIAFSNMKEGDRTAIEQLIAEHQRAVYQAKLRLDGMQQPVRCEAVLDQRIVHLSTALPFLRLAADVGVVLGDGEELETSGVISKNALDPAYDDGVPRLALDVQLGGRGDDSTPANDEDATPPPTALPRPCGHPLPSVVVSRTLQSEVLARAVIVGRARPRRMRHTA